MIVCLVGFYFVGSLFSRYSVQKGRHKYCGWEADNEHHESLKGCTRNLWVHITRYYLAGTTYFVVLEYAHRQYCCLLLNTECTATVIRISGRSLCHSFGKDRAINCFFVVQPLPNKDDRTRLTRHARFIFQGMIDLVLQNTAVSRNHNLSPGL